MGRAYVAQVTFKAILRGYGGKVLIIVSLSLLALVALSRTITPSALLLALLVPTSVSIVITDSMLYESIIYALLISGAQPKDFTYMKMLASMLIGSALAIPYALLGIWAASVAVLESLITVFIALSAIHRSMRLKLASAI
jgi:hypothetical protein